MYKACVDASYCTAPNCTGSSTSTSPYCNYGASATRHNHPVNYVSWHQMMTFAAWVGARLPTESEREFAASSRTGATYPWGETSPTCTFADFLFNGSSCNGAGTSPVCNTTSGDSAQDVCDLSGNLLEWVQDEGHSSYTGAPNDGTGWCSGSACPENANDSLYNASDTANRVLRGGGWNDGASSIRAAHRNGNGASSQFYDVGGRLARSVD